MEINIWRNLYCANENVTVSHKFIGDTHVGELVQGAQFECVLCRRVKIVRNEFLDGELLLRGTLHAQMDKVQP